MRLARRSGFKLCFICTRWVTSHGTHVSVRRYCWRCWRQLQFACGDPGSCLELARQAYRRNVGCVPGAWACFVRSRLFVISLVSSIGAMFSGVRVCGELEEAALKIFGLLRLVISGECIYAGFVLDAHGESIGPWRLRFFCVFASTGHDLIPATTLQG